MGKASAAARSREAMVLNPSAEIDFAEYPFRHLVIDKVFTTEFYESLTHELAAKLGRGLSEEEGLTAPPPGEERFRRFSHYDAYHLILNPQETAPSQYFFSAEWRDHVNSFFNLKVDANTLTEAHHHKIASGDGYVHNDYEVVSFARAKPARGLNGWYYQCRYRGRNTDEQTVRSLALLFYWGNPPWREGDGGETALYLYHDGHPIPIRKVAPVNNRLLVFEVSHRSFHGFLSNKKTTRNSIAQWFHSPEKEVRVRYGEPPTDTFPARRNVVFTGATGNLGRAFVTQLSAHAKIVGVARHKPDELPQGLTFITGDIVTDAERIADEVLATLGTVDLLVNAAVLYQLKPLIEFTREDWMLQLETNLVAPWMLARAFLQRYWASRREDNLRLGRNIVNVSSTSGFAVYGGGQGVYATTKGALSVLTAHMGAELAEYGLRVNAIAPNSFPHRVSTESVIEAIVELDKSKTNGMTKRVGTL